MSDEKKEKKKEKREVEIVEEQAVEDLEFTLTTDEIVGTAKEAADVRVALLEKETEFERVKKRFKGEIESLEGDLADKLRLIRHGKETRKTACIKQLNYKTNTVAFLFNGEIMKERPMEANERQLRLIPGAPTVVLRDKEEEKAHMEKVVNGSGVDAEQAAKMGVGQNGAKANPMSDIDEVRRSETNLKTHSRHL